MVIGPIIGGFKVTISGVLHSGSAVDVLGASLARIPVASIDTVSPGVLVVTADAAPSGVTDYVVVNSTAFFNTVGASFTYHVPGTMTLCTVRLFTIVCCLMFLTRVQPNNGPLTGENVVTITGTAFTNGVVGDVYNVTVAGIPVTTIVSFTATQVVVTVAPAPATTTGDVIVSSKSYGASTGSSLYTYNPSGTISSVVPSDGPKLGGRWVTITGSNLGNGSDIYLIKLRGVMVAAYENQTATSITVLSRCVLSCNVRVHRDSLHCVRHDQHEHLHLQPRAYDFIRDSH